MRRRRRRRPLSPSSSRPSFPPSTRAKQAATPEGEAGKNPKRGPHTNFRSGKVRRRRRPSEQACRGKRKNAISELVLDDSRVVWAGMLITEPLLDDDDDDDSFFRSSPPGVNYCGGVDVSRGPRRRRRGPRPPSPLLSAHSSSRPRFSRGEIPHFEIQERRPEAPSPPPSAFTSSTHLPHLRGGGGRGGEEDLKAAHDDGDY